MREQYDVVIVGGAAVGSSAAYFLAANPDFNGTLLVVEQDASYQKAATTLSAASIRHQFSTAGNIRMSLFGTEFVRAMGQTLAVDGEQPDAGFHEGGYLFLATAAGLPVLQANHAVQRAEGADVVLLTPAQMLERFPWLNVEDLVAGSLGLSGEGWLDAYSLLRAIRRKAISLGAEYVQARASALLSLDGRISGVRLDDGRCIAAGTVINAAGNGASALAASAGIELPVHARKRCVFYFDCAEAVPKLPLLIDPNGAYVRPEGKGFIAGIQPDAEHDPDSTDFDVDWPLWEDVLWPTLATRIPAFEAVKVRNAWAGHYDMNLFDHNLILGAHPEFAGLLFANGLSGHGLQQSPAIGRALAELIVYGAFRSLDLSEFSWQRVLENQPLREINVV